MRATFLGVENSLTGKRWVTRGGGPETERLGLTLAQRHDLPEVVGRVMAARGVGLDEADAFLTPSLRGSLPDPSLFQDMDLAAERLAKAVRDGETIGIFGDYDVDGATSAALLARFLDAVGGRTLIHVPDRAAEGYGPNLPAMTSLKDRGARIVVTVDCGILAHEVLAAAANDGIETIIIDHHMAEPRLPEAVAVVNPNRLDETAGHGYLAAVGVCYLVVVAVNRALRSSGWYEGKVEPNLLTWLDLVALGTVCDVVPLIGLNRVLVTQGLRVMATRGNPGMAALADVARTEAKPDTYQLGFILGPRVNAGGRVGEAPLGARLLATEDAGEAREIAARLDAYNTERREIEQSVLAEAIDQVEREARDDPVLVVAREGWHQGVIGIVAGRLRERYNRPACVVALQDGLGKGSGRSVPGVSLGPAVIAAHQSGILLGGGGHAMAAGFSVAADRLDELRGFLSGRAADEIGKEPPTPTLGLDGALAVGGANRELVEILARLEPFGTANSEPRFAVAEATVVKADVVGERHVRCILSGRDGGRLKSIAFRAMENELGIALCSGVGRRFHIAGKVRPDDWRGAKGSQLIIDDAAPVL